MHVFDDGTNSILVFKPTCKNKEKKQTHTHISPNYEKSILIVNISRLEHFVGSTKIALATHIHIVVPTENN